MATPRRTPRTSRHTAPRSWAARLCRPAVRLVIGAVRADVRLAPPVEGVLAPTVVLDAPHAILGPLLSRVDAGFLPEDARHRAHDERAAKERGDQSHMHLAESPGGRGVGDLHAGDVGD